MRGPQKSLLFTDKDISFCIFHYIRGPTSKQLGCPNNSCSFDQHYIYRLPLRPNAIIINGLKPISISMNSIGKEKINYFKPNFRHNGKDDSFFFNNIFHNLLAFGPFGAHPHLNSLSTFLLKSVGRLSPHNIQYTFPDAQLLLSPSFTEV